MENYRFILDDYWWIFLTILVCISIGFIFTKKRHHYKIKQGSRILKKIRTFDDSNNEKRIISYLQKIDPFTFEEMLLTLFKESGAKIYRNKKYTGDGGIDGKFKYNGKWYLIQAKRYKNYINAKDVEKFDLLCKLKKMNGVFIHTGLTGKASKTIADNSTHIEIIEPEDLVKFINGHAITIKK